jgi:glyoxylase-like metal-dependent hydrolase (beta-lactamase superfamily II)/rhodanese-related sulfurtransferase
MDAVQVELFYLGCLAHASYLVSSEGVAAVIDPQRDVDIYIETAARDGLRIEHIIETHLHADFVSGHRELASRTGARIYIGAASGARFPHIPVHDGDSIQFGSCQLRFLETPGHTAESVSVAMTDLRNPGHPKAVFTGDTLFVGDVGRPDLSAEHTPEELAAMLYRSLHEKLLVLPDDTVVYPAHGAGSLCGRQMGSDRSSTIGRERVFNYALQAKNSEEFVSLLTESLPPRPEYFQRDVELNREGAAPIDALPQLDALSAARVKQLQSEGAVVLDTRPATQFAAAHVPGAVHIALSGQYASWAARLLGLDARIVICAEEADHIRESQLRLARVGVERIEGYLDEGASGWIRAGLEAAHVPQVTGSELHDVMEREHDHLLVLDVREPSEVGTGGIDGSVHIPLGQLPKRLNELDREKLVVVHCKSGYRSSIATSLLKREGFAEVANLIGGFDAWQSAEAAVAR